MADESSEDDHSHLHGIQKLVEIIWKKNRIAIIIIIFHKQQKK